MFTVESASNFFAIAGLIAGFITALLACFGWYFANKDSDLKSAALKKFQSEAGAQIATANAKGEEATARAAEAIKQTELIQKENLELKIKLAETEKRVLWRTLDEKFTKTISKAPPATVEIKYKQDDSEAYYFGNQIRRELIGARWTVTGPPSPETSKTSNPFMYEVAGVISNFQELYILVGPNESLKAEPLVSLVAAFKAAGFKAFVNNIPADANPPEPGTIRIIVGSRL